MRSRSLLVGFLIVAMSLATPVRAEHDPPSYSDQQIQDLIDYAFATLPNLEAPNPEPAITGDPSVDQRIWELAYQRGYQLQPSATELVSRHGLLMQELAADAWSGLRQAAAAAGHEMAIISAHRDLDEQRNIFNSRLQGTSDADIRMRLARAAPPGASRHHSGYVFDVREVGDTFGIFGETPSYEWLASGNYHNAMLFGFLPSYPPSITNVGPDPEPWEWVYVGQDVIFHDGPFWDVLPDHLFVVSIDWMATTGITRGCSSDGEFFCPGLAVDRGQMAAFLRRALNLPASSTDHFSDDENSIFEADINAIAEAGITRGCNPPLNSRYCPNDDVDRGAMAALLVRALSLDPSSVDHFDDDNDSIFEADIDSLAASGITKGCGERSYCPGEPLSRGEMAAMLYRARHLLAVQGS